MYTPNPAACTAESPHLYGQDFCSADLGTTKIDCDSTGIKQNARMEQSWEQVEVPVSEQRLLRVAIIGTPNAGKSTLVNHLVQKRVSS